VAVDNSSDPIREDRGRGSSSRAQRILVTGIASAVVVVVTRVVHTLNLKPGTARPDFPASTIPAATRAPDGTS
jgi:hypothetical protein